MPTQYSLEESLEKAAVSVLGAVSGLSSCRIVSADESDEETLPQIAVRAEKLDELVLGMQTWNVRLSVTLTNAADETPAEEIADRRYPEDEDDDTGATGLKSLWKTLTDAVQAQSFVASLNATDLVKVWGMECEAVSYGNGQRTFTRTVPLRMWANEAYPAA